MPKALQPFKAKLNHIPNVEKPDHGLANINFDMDKAVNVDAIPTQTNSFNVDNCEETQTTHQSIINEYSVRFLIFYKLSNEKLQTRRMPNMTRHIMIMR